MPKVSLSKLIETWDAVDNLELALEIVHGTKLPSGYTLHEFIQMLQSRMGTVHIGKHIYNYAMGGLSSVYFYNMQPGNDLSVDGYSLMYSTIDDITLSVDTPDIVKFCVKTIDSTVTIKIRS